MAPKRPGKPKRWLERLKKTGEDTEKTGTRIDRPQFDPSARKPTGREPDEPHSARQAQTQKARQAQGRKGTLGSGLDDVVREARAKKEGQGPSKPDKEEEASMIQRLRKRIFGDEPAN